MIVMDKSTDIIAAIRRIAYFYKHELRPVHALPRGLRLDVARAAAHGAGRGGETRDRPAPGHDDQDRRPHHLCARRRRGLAVQGLIRHFRGEIEARIDRYQAAQKRRR